MKKIKVLDMQLKDFTEYINLRACDGNWSHEIVLMCFTVIDNLPRGFYRKKNKWFRDKIINGCIFNTNQHPNMWIDIETGEIGGLNDDK